MTEQTNHTTSATTDSDHPAHPAHPAIGLLAALPLEDGRLWGSAAHDFQLDDARAIIQRDVARHFLLRGRGLSKTTDCSAVALSLLLTEAPSASQSVIVAADSDQAQLFMDALRGFVDRANLRGMVTLGAASVTSRANGATLSVLSSDSASAYGLRPWLSFVDELAVWPNTRNHRDLWGAVVSAVPKVPGSRLVVITTAGSPTGLGREVFDMAATNREHWRVAVTPGPAPWWSADDIAATQASLTPAQYRRLILCEWAEADDSLTTPDDVQAAVRGGSTTLPFSSARKYVAALDVGTRRDLTALVVAHTERRPTGRVVVVDRVVSWKPSDQDGGKVDLQEVEEAARRLCKEYRAPLHFDRMQAEQLTTNLRRSGVTCKEFLFTAAGANRLARTLFTALRDRALSIPDDEETIREFMSVRLVETGPATIKLQNPRNEHDDIVTAIGIAATVLLDEPEHGAGSVTVPSRKLSEGRLTRAANSRRRRTGPSSVDLRRAARKLPRGMPGGGQINLGGDR